jgi:hypothetical protein
VDHHTLFFINADQAGFNHAAFEVTNWDALMSSHYALLKAGHRHSFGVGKHILGSQTFDYWKDPDGFTLEHFTDGDLLNESFGSQNEGSRICSAHTGAPTACQDSRSCQPT